MSVIIFLLPPFIPCDVCMVSNVGNEEVCSTVSTGTALLGDDKCCWCGGCVSNRCLDATNISWETDENSITTSLGACCSCCWTNGCCGGSTACIGINVDGASCLVFLCFVTGSPDVIPFAQRDLVLCQNKDPLLSYTLPHTLQSNVMDECFDILCSVRDSFLRYVLSHNSQEKRPEPFVGCFSGSQYERCRFRFDLCLKFLPQCWHTNPLTKTK